MYREACEGKKEIGCRIKAIASHLTEKTTFHFQT